MKVVKSRFLDLLAEKRQREKRAISIGDVWRESGVSKRAAYGMANDALREYPKDALEKLCRYFECDLSELLVLEEA